jgi:hypothetical protein
MHKNKFRIYANQNDYRKQLYVKCGRAAPAHYGVSIPDSVGVAVVGTPILVARSRILCTASLICASLNVV